MTADCQDRSLAVRVIVDATVASGGLRFLASSKAALRLFHLPAAQYTEGGPKGFGGFGRELVLRLLSVYHRMGERV